MSGHELAAIALTGFVVGSFPGFIRAVTGVRLYWLTIATVAALYWTSRMIGA